MSASGDECDSPTSFTDKDWARYQEELEELEMRKSAKLQEELAKFQHRQKQAEKTRLRRQRQLVKGCKWGRCAFLHCQRQLWVLEDLFCAAASVQSLGVPLQSSSIESSGASCQGTGCRFGH